MYNDGLPDNFGFNEVSVRDFMWIINSRKYPEYSANRMAFQNMNDVLFEMNANTAINGAQERLKPAIQYFESIKKKYSSSSKHDRKIRYSSYFNLAVLYYYLDDPQLMIKEANGLILNDFDTKDGKGFEKTAIWLKNLFQLSNVFTRHFSIDTSAFRGPYEKNAVTAK